MRLEQVPQKSVTKAARAGARIAYRAAKAKAPVDTGELKRAIIMKAERRQVKGKRAYQVTISAALNDTFVKISKAGKRSYYPASQEYGFFAENGRYIPGYRYLRRAIDEHEQTIRDVTLDTVGKDIDKALRG
jgi:hypothetical protein